MSGRYHLRVSTFTEDKLVLGLWASVSAHTFVRLQYVWNTTPKTTGTLPRVSVIVLDGTKIFVHDIFTNKVFPNSVLARIAVYQRHNGGDTSESPLP